MRHAAIASSLVSLAAVGLLAGCPDRTISTVDPKQGRVEFKDIPVKINRNVDILFVIDDSPSMRDKQTNLAFNFPRFIDVLKTIPGGLPNVHIAVVTSDAGTKDSNGTVAAGIGSLGQGGCSGSGKGGDMQLFGAPVTGGLYISDIQQMDGSRVRNYPDPMNDSSGLAPVFSTMAKAGAGGCGFEQHLQAMKLALDKNPANAGFLRDDAFLAVIFIADEDDCSMSDSKSLLGADGGPLGPLQSFRCTRYGIVCDDNGTSTTAMNQTGTKGRCHPAENSPYLAKVSEYVSFLKSLKPNDPSKLIVAGIMGTSDPFEVELRALPPPKNATKVPALAHSCTYVGVGPPPENKAETEVADPPIRLRFFLDQFPNRSTFATICQKDLSSGLQQIGDLLKTVIGNPCIEGKLADADPTTPGTQYDCSVSAVADPGKPTAKEQILPQCPGNGKDPCWHLDVDQANCKNVDSDHLTLVIDHKDALSMFLGVGDTAEIHEVASCVTIASDATTQ